MRVTTRARAMHRSQGEMLADVQSQRHAHPARTAQAAPALGAQQLFRGRVYRATRYRIHVFYHHLSSPDSGPLNKSAWACPAGWRVEEHQHIWLPPLPRRRGAATRSCEARCDDAGSRVRVHEVASARDRAAQPCCQRWKTGARPSALPAPDCESRQWPSSPPSRSSAPPPAARARSRRSPPPSSTCRCPRLHPTSSPPANAIAFGAVATGSMNANDAAIVPVRGQPASAGVSAHHVVPHTRPTAAGPASALAYQAQAAPSG